MNKKSKLDNKSIEYSVKKTKKVNLFKKKVHTIGSTIVITLSLLTISLPICMLVGQILAVRVGFILIGN